MDGNMSLMYCIDVTPKIACKLWKVFFLMKTAVKFRNLQISKILNTNTNNTFQGCVHTFEK